ncbi:hypothetical protein Fot_50462 [Forsythia ovata]|uniref:DUF7913 domain-containing protein n=1 Tax=Forsythia ovata TaxID=205694 RepID=A0ABD1PYB1_9LAMI
MAPDSDIASEKSEACPREDLVLALMEYLVDPRLPSRVSDNDPPDLSVQQAVSKQMHAVVLLYNYFHRKQHPDIEFLDFVAFCKLSVIMRPTMSAFMKFTNQGESTELNDINDGLSVTEKAIRDACNISVVLDVSKDVPDTEGWPISKVAVLLIDSNKENCLLQFGSVTEGIWSLVEKELDESIINSEISAEETQYIGTYVRRWVLGGMGSRVREVGTREKWDECYLQTSTSGEEVKRGWRRHRKKKTEMYIERLRE